MQQKVVASGLWRTGKQERPCRGMTVKPKLEQQDAGMMSISAEAAGQHLTRAMAQMLFSPRGSSSMDEHKANSAPPGLLLGKTG